MLEFRPDAGATKGMTFDARASGAAFYSKIDLARTIAENAHLSLTGMK